MQNTPSAQAHEISAEKSYILRMSSHSVTPIYTVTQSCHKGGSAGDHHWSLRQQNGSRETWSLLKPHKGGKEAQRERKPQTEKTTHVPRTRLSRVRRHVLLNVLCTLDAYQKESSDWSLVRSSRASCLARGGSGRSMCGWNGSWELTREPQLAEQAREKGLVERVSTSILKRDWERLS